MKTINILISSLLLFGLTIQSEAKIWRVDNNPGNPSNVTTAQDAHDSASAGDTLYFSGSGIEYGDLVMSKTLYIFGPGYYLSENPETQANKSSAIIANLDINSGASGSLITGMYIYTVDINTNNIFFKRNRLSNGASFSPDNSIVLASNLSNIFIVQNFIYRISSGSGSSYSALYINSGGTNIVVKNNIIRHGRNSSSYFSVFSNSSIDFGQNVCQGSISIGSSTLYNNILYSGNFSGSGNTFTNNMGDGTQFGTSNGNITNANMSNEFAGGSSSDGYYQLDGSSQGIGAGVNGEDLGAFGGDDPYVLSGIPSIPAIYYLNAPSSGSSTQGLPVEIRMKSRN